MPRIAPPGSGQIPGLTTKVLASIAGKAPTGPEIAYIAQSYKGKLRYVFGGKPANGVVDCSSFVSMILGWILGLAIPTYKAGTYTGQSHGPVVLAYAIWGGSYRVKTAAPGDLCIWAGPGGLGHIGIATGPHTMVSALNPSDGIRETPIKGTGPSGAPFSVRRVKAATGGNGLAWGQGAATGAGATAAGCSLTGAAGGSPAAFLLTFVLVFALVLAVSWCWRLAVRRRAGRGLRKSIAAAALAAADRSEACTPCAASDGSW